MTGQLSLFEKDDRKDDRIKSLLKHLVRTGRRLQYYEVYLKQFTHINQDPFSDVFKALGDVVTLSGTLYTTLGEISSLKHLKTLPDEFEKLFRSNLNPGPLDEFSIEEAKLRLEDVKLRFRSLAQWMVDGVDRGFYTEYQIESAIKISMKILILLATIKEDTVRISDKLNDI